MEADQKLGSVGSASESFSAGVGVAKASVALPQTAYGLTLKISAEVDEDATVLMSYLAAKAGGTIPAEIATWLNGILKTVS